VDLIREAGVSTKTSFEPAITKALRLLLLCELANVEDPELQRAVVALNLDI